MLHDVGDCGETGEDRVAMQLSASGLDIATAVLQEHPCPAEVLQDLHARRHEGPQSREHKRPLWRTEARSSTRDAASRTASFSETALVQPKSQESRRQSRPRHLEW